MGRSGSSAGEYPDAAYEPPLLPDEWDSETSDALIQPPPLPLFQQTPIPAAAGESSLPASWPNISAGLAPPVHSAQQEEEEWKRKYETQIALEKAAAAVQESREAELSSALAEKENKIKDQATKIEQAEQRLTALNFELKAAESKIKNHNLEKSTLKLEIMELTEKVDSANFTALSAESQARILEQEKMHLEQKYQAQLQNFNEVQERCKTAEREAKKAMELADKARDGAASAQKEKSDFEHVAAERFTQIERAKRHAETLEKQTADLANEVKRYKAAEGDALSKVELLEGIVREKDKKIDSLLQSNNSRRKNTDQISESLLESGHAALSEANNRAEGLRAQLQIVQGKFDELTKELTANRFSEKRTVESKLGTASVSMHGRADDDEIGVDYRRPAAKLLVDYISSLCNESMIDLPPLRQRLASVSKQMDSYMRQRLRPHIVQESAANITSSDPFGGGSTTASASASATAPAATHSPSTTTATPATTASGGGQSTSAAADFLNLLNALEDFSKESESFVGRSKRQRLV